MLGISDQFQGKLCVDTNTAKSLITHHYTAKWSHEVLHLPKLRTYTIFKTYLKCESYVRMNLSTHERSLLCQIRTDILRIETGRSGNTEQVETRICSFFYLNCVEDEKHFLLTCGLYSTNRTYVFGDNYLISE